MQSGVCSAVGTGQTSLFGNNQNKLGTTLGTMGTFGATAFNSGTSNLGFGAPQQPVGETDCDRLSTLFTHVSSGLDVVMMVLCMLMCFLLQRSPTRTQRPLSRPCSSSSSASWRIRRTETRRCSETRCQTPRRKRR